MVECSGGVTVSTNGWSYGTEWIRQKLFVAEVRAQDLLGAISVVESAVSQCAILVVAHGPQTALALEEQTVRLSGGNRRDVGGHNSRTTVIVWLALNFP